MGHQRLGTLPKTRQWNGVIELIAGGADIRDIAAAVSQAAESGMIDTAKDPAARLAFYLLTQLPLAARSSDFIPQLRMLGLKLGNQPSLMDIAAAFADTVDRQARTVNGRTDFGDMVQLAAVESLNAVVGRELPTLFGATTDDVRIALAGFATEKQFGVLARDFFGRLARRQIDYYLSRELPKHVGIGSRFQTVREHHAFVEALELHCHETARITQDFAGEWFSKTNYYDGIDEAKAGKFVHVACRKIRDELRVRRGANV